MMNRSTTISSIKSLAVIVLLFITNQIFAQFTATFTTTENTNCAGNPCNYEGPGILINEIMIAPSVFDGSLWGGPTTYRGEWIELYNPDVCNAIDISCWYLGNNATDNQIAYPGGYVIPVGTIVPPAGFLILRGTNMTPVPPELLVQNGGNTIEIEVNNGVCVGGGERLWFPNAGGWFAFYDNNGVPQDAVSWANQSNIGNNPCVPNLAGCNAIGGLSSYNAIPSDRKEYITSSNPSSFLGQSLRRIPDGGAWSGFSPPTYGLCNADCAQIGNGSDCTGTATVFVQGGNPPYFYYWPNAEGQTEQTAVNLCGGMNEVIVFDMLGAFQSFFVEVEEPSFESEVFADICQGQNYILPNFTPINQPGSYPVMLQNVNGCDSLVTYNINVFPTFSASQNVVICPGQTHTMPNGSQVGIAGTYTYVFPSVNSCDSTIIVNLSLEPVITIPSNPQICQGETFTLPNGQVVNTTGLYQVSSGNGTGCDTIFAINLTVNPTYFNSFPVQICQGETYVLPDGNPVGTSGTYNISFTTVNGCDSTIQVIVNVNPLPQLSVNLQQNYCYGTGVVQLNPTPPGGTLVGGNITGTVLNLTNAGPGNYPVTYTYTNPNTGCSNTLNTSYNVTSPIFPAFEYTTYCNSATFTNLTPNTQPNFNYTWSLDGTTVSTLSSFTYPFQFSGEYTMTLTVSDNTGCVYNTSQYVEFESALDLADFLIPNVITANSDGFNDALRVAPVGNECLEYRITILNRWGKKVYEMTDKGAPFRGISESGAELTEGTYYYIFESPQVNCDNPQFAPYCKGSITLLR